MKVSINISLAEIITLAEEKLKNVYISSQKEHASPKYFKLSEVEDYHSMSNGKLTAVRLTFST